MKKINHTEKNIVDILFDRKIVSFSFEPPYVYSSGTISPIYIDNQLLISFPEERKAVVNEMISIIKSKKELINIDLIASSLSAAAPFGVLVAEKLGLPLVLVREEKKSHGKRNKIEGKLHRGANVLVIEDHISTGSTLINSINAIRKNGGKVNYAIAITDYEIGAKALSQIDMNVFVLVKGSSILIYATKKGVLSKDEKEEVRDWLKNPIKWGEERGYYSIGVN